MPYCLYVRKSRADAEAEARGEGETLTRHINALLDLAKRRHFDITQIYREIVSGETIAARPVMQHLLSEVEQGIWDGVLVMEVERLARGDTVDQGIVAQTFKYSGTKIITPVKDYNPDNEFDEEYFEFGLFMSRREYKTINRRLQRGRKASIKEGKYVGSHRPYGYDRVKIVGDKGYTLTPNPDEADTLRLIFQLYTEGEKKEDGSFERLGVARIVRRLNEMHIKPPRSEHWSPPSVRDILINPIYMGKIRWNWRPNNKKMVDGHIVIERQRHSLEECELYDGLHPALVSEETFYKAQEYMKQNKARPVNERGVVKNPLAGIVICAKCGKRMVRRPYRGDYPDTLMCADTACDNISCHLYIVEQRLLEALAEWLSKYRLKWDAEDSNEEVISSADYKRKALKQLIKEHEKLTKQLDTTHDLLEQGVYTTDLFLERSRVISGRIQQNISDRDVLLKDIATEEAKAKSRELIIPKVEKLLDVYYSLPTPQAKNDLLKEVLEKVVYLKERSGRYKGNPIDDFELTVYPKLPNIE